MKKEKKRGGRAKKVIIVILLAVLAAGGTYVYMTGLIGGGNEGGEVTTISESSLQEVIEISELSTVEYTYNAIASAYDKDGKTLKYHVAYDGTVKAGIDLEDISIDVDEENKKINITVPEVKILDYAVDNGTLTYIFEDDKYNTADISDDAYKLCLSDLKEKASQEGELLDLGKENAVSAVKGLIEPWVEQLDHHYTVKVN